MAVTSDRLFSNEFGFHGDKPYLLHVKDKSSVSWTITKAPVVKRSVDEESDVAEHGADYLLFLTVDGQSFSRPLYALSDYDIEDAMIQVANERERVRRQDLLEEKKVITLG